MPTYSHAPAVEAILDVRVDGVVPKAAAVAFIRLRQAYADEFPLSGDSLQDEVDLRPGPDGVAVESRRSGRGFFVQNREGTRVVQATTAGFSFHWLRPYAGWDAFFAAAWPAWQLYEEALQPPKFTSASLRYLNFLSHPDGQTPVASILAFRPEVPSIDGGTLAGAASDARFRFEDNCVGTLRLSPAEDRPAAGYLDVMVSQPMPPGLTAAELARLFGDLRDRKNLLFESCLTDAARETFG